MKIANVAGLLPSLAILFVVILAFRTIDCSLRPGQVPQPRNADSELCDNDSCEAAEARDTGVVLSIREDMRDGDQDELEDWLGCTKCSIICHASNPP